MKLRLEDVPSSELFEDLEELGTYYLRIDDTWYSGRWFGWTEVEQSVADKLDKAANAAIRNNMRREK